MTFTSFLARRLSSKKSNSSDIHIPTVVNKAYAAAQSESSEHVEVTTKKSASVSHFFSPSSLPNIDEYNHLWLP